LFFGSTATDHVYLEELNSNYSEHKLEEKGHQHDVTNSFNCHNDALDNVLKSEIKSKRVVRKCGNDEKKIYMYF